MYRTYGSIFGQILVAISSDDFFNVIEINIFLSLSFSLFLSPLPLTYFLFLEMIFYV